MDTRPSIEDIYHAARALEGEARARYLDQACAGNEAARTEVQALLDADADAGSFLSGVPQATVATPEAERPGATVGPYTLVEVLGEGGFGVVFKAAQTSPVRRTVALKIIKLGMDTRQVVARFEQERQALAIMDHPGIATVFDAGATKTGRPYFAMEYVPGVPIVEFCDDNRLNIDERLDLFAQVCHAVQHAHTKGIIHRDIKPNNVIVSMVDGKPRAKVIDFGVAKATNARLTERTLFTEHRQLIGTPEYMSPEQAGGAPDIDMRTDVYSLGVLLYELLTGATPHDPKTLRSAAFGEIQRIIREVEPAAPSRHLGQNADTIGSIAAKRRTEPRRLGTLVRGELDWIVMRAMEKDRQRRYKAASDLAQDVERYLAGEAIVAAPPSQVYRTRKFVRRNKGVVASAALLVTVLVLGIAATSWQAGVAREQRDLAVLAGEAEARERARATIERDKARLISDFMSRTLRGIDAQFARGQDTTLLKQMMDTAAASIEQGELADSPEAELQLRRTIGSVYRSIALHSDSARMLEPTIALARTLYGEEDPEVYHSLTDVAWLARETGDVERSEALYRQSLALRRRLHPAGSSQVADGARNLAYLLEASGRPEEARVLWAEATTTLEAEVQALRDQGNDAQLARRTMMLAQQYRILGDLDAAERMLREGLAAQRRLYPLGHRDTSDTLAALAVVLQQRRAFSEAAVCWRESIELCRALYPGDHPITSERLSILATLLYVQDELEEAEALAIESLEMKRRLKQGDHPSIASTLFELAQVQLKRSKGDAAEVHLRESIAMTRRLFTGDNVVVATRIIALANLLRDRDELTQAESLYREALEIRRRLFPSDHPQVRQLERFLEGWDSTPSGP